MKKWKKNWLMKIYGFSGYFLIFFINVGEDDMKMMKKLRGKDEEKENKSYVVVHHKIK